MTAKVLHHPAHQLINMRFRSIVPVLQRSKKRTGIRRVRSARQKVQTTQRNDITDLRLSQHKLFHFLRQPVSPLQRSTIRQHNSDNKAALVFLWNKRTGRYPPQVNRSQKESDKNQRREKAKPNDLSNRSHIDLRYPVKYRVKPAKRTARLGSLRFQQHAAHGRAQCQRHDSGNTYRNRNSHRELLI